MPSPHASVAMLDMGTRTRLFVGHDGSYMIYDKDEPWTGLFKLPIEGYRQIVSIPGTEDWLRWAFGRRRHLWCRVYRNYDGGLDMELFRGGAGLGGVFVLQMPETMPGGLAGGSLDLYPRPCDWWVSTGMQFKHPIPMPSLDWPPMDGPRWIGHLAEAAVTVEFENLYGPQEEE